MVSTSGRFPQNWSNLSVYDRHKILVNEYVLTKKGSTIKLQRDSSKDKHDIDIIRENHKFLWDETKDVADTWEKKLAKKYYDKLFKEYCISDLSRYKENKVAMRWRIEKELIDGKGQFICGEKKCTEKDDLRSWEVNFGYLEDGEKKKTLVKLRLCPSCSKKLNYHHKKREIKKKRLKHRHDDTVAGKLKKVKVDDDDDGGNEVVEKVSDNVTTNKQIEQTESEADFWKTGGTSEPEEKSREDEFQEYLEDLLL